MSFRMDWLDLFAVQGALKSLLQHHASKSSILQCSAFFIVQLSHPYMTTGKTIALTRQIFVGKVMSKQGYVIYRLVCPAVEPNAQILRVPPLASLSNFLSTSSGLLEAFSQLWGACRTPPWGPEGPEFLLVWRRVYIKILWGHPHCSIP